MQALCDKLLAWRCAQEMSGFEILHHIAGLGCTGTSDRGCHQVGAHLTRRETTVGELRDFTHPADGVDIGFTHGANCDD